MPKTDSSSTLCEGVSRGSMVFSSNSFSKIADMKFVLKPNMKKDKQRAARWEEIKINSFVTSGRYKPNLLFFSVFAALTAAEHQRTCSTLKRVPHKEVQVLCWTWYMQALKASGNISTENLNLSVRGRTSTTFRIYYRQKKKKKKQTFFSCKLRTLICLNLT